MDKQKTLAVDLLMGISSTTEILAEKIAAQREEILTAFLAKYNCDPDKAEQVVTFMPDQILWKVRRRE